MDKIQRKASLIIFLMIAVFVGGFYYYCFVSPHVISIVRQGDFTIIATCEPVSVFTSAPYVSVRLNGMEILKTSVNQGYDFTSDCMGSSVKRTELDESGKKVRIYMKNGLVKEIDIIGVNTN